MVERQVTNNLTFSPPLHDVASHKENSIGEVPFVGLIEYDFPEYASLHAIQVNEGSYPHLKALLYHDLNDTNEEILPGEIMIAPRLIIEQYEMIPLSLTYDCAGNSLRLQIFQS